MGAVIEAIPDVLKHNIIFTSISSGLTKILAKNDSGLCIVNSEISLKYLLKFIKNEENHSGILHLK